KLRDKATGAYANIAELINGEFDKTIADMVGAIKIPEQATEDEKALIQDRKKALEKALKEQQQLLLGLLEQVPEAQKALGRVEGGGYKPLAWSGVLEQATAEVLAKLLPEDRAARALFAGRLRLHADPEYAADKLGEAVRPWQAALQQKLARVED